MKTNYRVLLIAGVLALIGLVIIAGNCQAAGLKKAKPDQTNTQQAVPIETKNKILVTFVELGSVNCIPCKAMQPVMKEIEEEYGDQVKVVFHDVWTEAGQPYGRQYQIRAIPTQVFLDQAGREFFRHTGFFSKQEIVKILKQQGVK